MGNPTQSFSLMLYAAAMVFGVSGILAFAAYLARRRGPLFPPTQPPRLVPWNGWTVVGAFVLVVLVPTMLLAVLVESRFFQALYGPDFPMSAGNSTAEKQAANVRNLWTHLIASPLVWLAVIWATRLLHNTSFDQLGLTISEFPNQFLSGWIAWLIATPIVFGVYLITLTVSGTTPEPHPLTQLGEYRVGLEPIALGVAVIVLAPLVEELVVRGLLLQTIVAPPTPYSMSVRGSDIVCVVAILFTLTTQRTADFLQARDWSKIAEGLAPFWFVLAMMVPYYLLAVFRLPPRWGTTTEIQGIFASSLLFAAIHSNVWPSPIPLLVLGVALGWITLRTRSIIPAIILHSLFNAVSATYLWLGGK